ncbi:MAG: hypothetical protein JXB88_14865 [Spirochaetales bacterium]|nr:hypothetical protein [Spirochaetales bacterium]
MKEGNIIQIQFTSEESQFYTLMQKYCNDKGISITDYIKDLIKKDLAWGHFKKQKKSKDNKKRR